MIKKISTATRRVTVAGGITGSALRLLLAEPLSAVALYEHLRKKKGVTQAGVYHAIHALLRVRFIRLEGVVTVADADKLLVQIEARLEGRGVRGSSRAYCLTDTGRIAAMALEMEAAAERNRPSRIAAMRQGILATLIALKGSLETEKTDGN